MFEAGSTDNTIILTLVRVAAIITDNVDNPPAVILSTSKTTKKESCSTLLK